MAEEKKGSNSNVIIILLIIVIVLLIGGGVTAFVLLSNNQSTNNTITETGNTAQANQNQAQGTQRKLSYEQGVVALDADSLQRAVDEAFAKTEDGYITLDFSAECLSTDGQNFSCTLGNSPENKRDMYIGIYLNGNFDDEYFLSGLIRPGDQLYTFKGNYPLENGVYEAVATMTQVEDDHETMSYQTSVVITLKVDKTDR